MEFVVFHHSDSSASPCGAFLHLVMFHLVPVLRFLCAGFFPVKQSEFFKGFCKSSFAKRR